MNYIETGKFVFRNRTNETKIITKARNNLNWLRKNYPDEYEAIATYLYDYNVELEN